MTEPLVSVDGLEKYFYEHDSMVDQLLRRDPVAVKAVDGVSFDIHRGETLGLVGESGCGKSTTGETLLRLQEPTGGEVFFDGTALSTLDATGLQEFRRNAQIVFQDPFSSLNPRLTVGEIVKEPLDIHDVGTAEDRTDRVRGLLERVGLSADQFDRYPHEFSGGQRQRIGIARALALEPDFIVLDEPTSALDVSVQAQILNLLDDLQTEFNLTYLLISHDLSVIRHISDRVAVMYLGELVEIGPTTTVFETPHHPYTTALLESIPRASSDEQDRDVDIIAGDVPSPRDPPSGCRFRTRCPVVIPPHEDIDQATFRAIMDLRQRIESRDIDTDGLGDETTSEAERTQRLKNRLFDGELSAPHDDRVETALAALVTGDWPRAAQTLREHYETVCETVPPALPEEDHPAACHRRAQPEAVEDAVTAWTETQRSEDPLADGQ